MCFNFHGIYVSPISHFAFLNSRLASALEESIDSVRNKVRRGQNVLFDLLFAMSYAQKFFQNKYPLISNIHGVNFCRWLLTRENFKH